MCSKERFQHIETFGTMPEGIFKGIKIFCQEKIRVRRISHLFIFKFEVCNPGNVMPVLCGNHNS